MRRSIRAQRYTVIATAAGVTILVTAALTGLGWRQLSQEATIEKQRRRDRLELASDRWLSGFVRVLDRYDAALAEAESREGDEVFDAVKAPGGAVLLQMSADGIHTRPDRSLLYHPVVPASHALDPRFAQADRLEFQSNDAGAAMRLLSSLSHSDNEQTRAEALLRLGRLHWKAKNTALALDSYKALGSSGAMSRADVPYSLLGRHARYRLLAESGHASEATAEAAALLADLETGRWPLRKEAYDHYTAALRTVPGITTPEPAPHRRALSEAAQVLLADWETASHREGFRQRRVYGSAGHALVYVCRGGRERLFAIALPWTQMVDALDSTLIGADPVAVTVKDDRDQPVVGSARGEGNTHVMRALSAAGMPGVLYFRAGDVTPLDSWYASRRKYFVGALMLVAGLVALACYAMARGLLRELDARALQADFISAVSHEFRSPLTTLGQMTELLADDRVGDTATRRLYLEVMQEETSRLRRLVENLLDFGRMQANRRQYEPEPFDFTELVRETVREYGGEVQSGGYSFELSTDEAPAMVEADREALRRVVRNLLENAVKYSPECRIVWIETVRQNGHAVLNVRDRGIGIPDGEQRRIFDRFVRGEAARQACIQGTGIGLAMVKEIVEAHSGRVEVTSEPAVGSTFAVRVPLKADTQARV